MNYEIIFRVEAEKDLEEIKRYYDRILPSITERFFVEFFETLQYIEQNLIFSKCDTAAFT